MRRPLLHGIGAVYLCAFVSLGVQLPGLLLLAYFGVLVLGIVIVVPWKLWRLRRARRTRLVAADR